MADVTTTTPPDVPPLFGAEIPDDRADAYMAHRDDQRERSAGQALLERMRQQQAPEAPTDAEPSDEQQQMEEPVGAVTLDIGTKQKPIEDVGFDIGAAARDVGEGLLIESPKQAVGGAVDALNEASNTAFQVADWLNENVADLGSISIGEEPEGGVEIIPGMAYWQPGMPDQNALQIPEGLVPADADTTTGDMIRNVFQFLTGFAVGGKALQGIKTTGTAGRIALDAAKGAIADMGFFNAQDGRLSDLIQKVPALQNPITEYLATQPGESEAEGRFKRAIEGMIPGVLVDGFVSALRGIRDFRAAKATVTPTQARQRAIQAAEPSIADDAFDGLGQPDAELITTKKAARGTKAASRMRQAAADVAGETPETVAGIPAGKNDVFINWSRIDTPDDVQTVVQDLADRMKPSIDKARRGVRSNVETQLAADQLNAWQVLLDRRAGSPLNAEQSLALRNLWAASGEKLTEVAKAARDNPNEANLFAFRKMLTVHHAVQNEVLAVRAETARALQQWAIPSGGGVEKARAIEEALRFGEGSSMSFRAAVGMENVHQELARRVAALADAGMHQELGSLVQKGWGVKTREAIQQVWINALLSGPKTHLVNTMSNTSVLFMQMAERGAAARLARVLGNRNSVATGEAMAQMFGMVQGLKDALRVSFKKERLGTFWKSIATGESGFGTGKIEVGREGSLSAEAFNVSSDTWLGRALDGLDTVTRVPGRALTAEDELFKTIGYRMELNAQALRQAVADVNAGKIAPDGVKDRIADILANPPQNIRVAALDAASYQTFTSAPGALTRRIQSVLSAAPALRFLVPFVNTPGNIMKYTFERTPLAPLMKQVRADIAAGGARRDLAMTRMAMGTMAMMATVDIAMSGGISGNGPSDPRERQTLRRTGWQPYSVKVGDRWFAYNRMDPLGFTLGLAADMNEIVMNGETSQDNQADLERAAVAMAMSIGNNAMSKTYMSGLSQFVTALGDPVRYGESYVQRFASSFVPTGVAEVARINDPYMREARNIVDALRRRTPGLTEDLPPRRDLWGQPISYQSGLGTTYDVVSPIYSSQEKPEPIDEEFLRLGGFPSTVPFKTAFDGVGINLDRYPGAYSRLAELAGNALKLPKYGNKGAMDALNDIVQGKSMFSPIYDLRSDGPDGGKMTFIRDVISTYREAAKDQLLDEFPEIRVEVRQKKEAQRKWAIQ